MSTENQLKSALKPVVGTFCKSCLKGKNVRFDFGNLYRQMEHLERSERHVKSVKQRQMCPNKQVDSTSDRNQTCNQIFREKI